MRTILILIVIDIAAKYIMFLILSETISPRTLLPGNIDFFSAGALLAVYKYKFNMNSLLAKLRKFLLSGVFFTLFVLIKNNFKFSEFTQFSFTEDVTFMFIIMWLIGRLSLGVNTFIGTSLQFKPLIYLGKISYGIYIYHYFIIFLSFSSSNSLWNEVVIKILVTIIIASLSWILIEKPISMKFRSF